MSEKLVYDYDPNTGIFIGTSYADESPLEPGIFLIPAHATEAVIPDFNQATQFAVWNGTGWDIHDIPQPEPAPEPAPPTLEEVQNDKIVKLNNSCNKNITSGFNSSATGAQHHYGFDIMTDQPNLTQQAVMLSLDPSITVIDWKTEDAGIIEHTRTQFIQVLNDAAIHKQACIKQYWQLKASVQAMTNTDDVNAVTWNDIE